MTAPAGTHASPDSGAAMYSLMTALYPICRSITGDGVRATLRQIAQLVPLTIEEVPSGTQVFDWTVPNEWNIRDAYVADASGRRVIDFQRHSLHVLNYSAPFRGTLPLAELRAHLHSLPDQPDTIPYRTSYYHENWGFCLAHNDLLALPDGDYEIVVDSTLAPGALTYGELVLPGATPDEVLISTHVCHPSLCNDNLSGIALAAFLAQALMVRERRLTYRFLFIPGTIGSITWLARNEALVPRIRHGLVITGLGDSADFTYKRSRRGAADIDRAAEYALGQRGAYRTLDFYPYGYDERQYCSPGFNLPVGLLMRSQHGTYRQYHSSEDNLSFVHPERMQESLEVLLAVVDILENNRRCLNLNPKCEPQLGRRGIYRAISGSSDMRFDQSALLWVLNYSDGAHDLLDIAQRSGIPFADVVRAAALLQAHDLLGDDTEGAHNH